MSRRLRGTKIVTMLGPATDRGNNLEKTIATGTNIVCMSLPCGSSEDHKLRVDKVRETAAKLGRHVAVLGDLQGPRIRVSTFKEDKVFLNIGDKFLLDANLGGGEGDEERVGIDYRGLPIDAVPGDILLLDDGRVRLKVLEVQSVKVFTEATAGGPLSNSKDISKLGGDLFVEALTEKDKADIITATQINVDYLAVSFPHCGEDLDYAHRLARDAGYDAKIIAKIECVEAACDQNMMDDIILASNVVMVARDDLGVEIGDFELMGIWKALIHRARQLNRAVITITQMMGSIIANPVPTCAEVMDVVNAVFNGTDAVMLSAETVAGQYPVETITVVARIYLGAEKIPNIDVSKHRLDVQSDNAKEVTTTSAMYATSHLEGVTATIAIMESDRIVLMTSRINSGLPIFAVSRHERTLNLISLHRGVTPIRSDSEIDGVVVINEAVSLLRDKGYLVPGDLVIVTQGDVMSTIGSTNTTRVLTVE